VHDGIPYQVKQRAGDRGITAENMEKSQHVDFNEDTTNESASVATRKYKLNILKNTKTNLALTKHKFKNNSYLRAYCCAQLSYITQNGAVLIIFPLYLHTDNDHRSDAVSGRRGEEFTPVADPGGVQVSRHPPFCLGALFEKNIF